MWPWNKGEFDGQDGHIRHVGPGNDGRQESALKNDDHEAAVEVGEVGRDG